MRAPVKYNDRPFRIFAAVVGAYFVSEYGGTDGFLSFQRLLTREFYIEYGCTLLIAVVLIEFIAGITRMLDRRFEWDNLLVRAGLQALLCIAIPTVLDFFLASLYFRLFGVDILETTYLIYAMPYIVLMLTLFNLYYVVYYFYLTRAETTQREPPQTGIPPDTELQDAAAPEAHRTLFPSEDRKKHEADKPSQSRDRPEDQKHLREAFLVSKGAETFSIRVEKVAYLYRNGRHTFLYTFDEKEFVLPQSLDSAEQGLSDEQFFRVNRQTIIHYDTFSFFKPAGGGKLKLGLKPRPPHDEPVLISQEKASDFRNWVDR